MKYLRRRLGESYEEYMADLYGYLVLPVLLALVTLGGAWFTMQVWDAIDGQEPRPPSVHRDEFGRPVSRD